MYHDKERNRKVYRAADCIDRNSHPYRPRHHLVYGHLSEKVPRTFEVLGIFRIFTMDRLLEGQKNVPPYCRMALFFGITINRVSHGAIS